MGQSRPARYLALGIAILLGSYLLITSTVSLSKTLWPYDVKRILQICLFPLIFASVLCNRSLRAGFLAQFERIPRWLVAALGLLILLGGLSSLANSSTAMARIYSLSDVSLLSLLAVATLCVAACRMVAGPVFDQTVIFLVALVALAVGLQELSGVVAAWNTGLVFNPRIALQHFSWPRFYNQIQSWIVPTITALPLVFPGKASARVLCVAALSLSWYEIFATGGRGSMAGLTAALAAGFILWPATRKLLIRYQLPSVMIGLLIYVLVILGHHMLFDGSQTAGFESSVAKSAKSRSPSITKKYQAELKSVESDQSFTGPMTGPRMWSTSGRLSLWSASLHDARTHPLLGIGPMNYACKGPIYRAASPHNFFLQILGEWGIPAFMLLMLIAGFLCLGLLRTLRKPEHPSNSAMPLMCFIAMGVLAASIHACVSGVLEMPASEVTGVLVTGFLLGLLPAKQAGGRTSLSTGHVVLFLSLALSFALLAFTRQEIAVSQTRFEQTPLMDRLIPRLWQNGKVCRLYQK